ncbi:hypothetical protein BpHYR1_007846, partial [Brachionus plicatilis]
MTDEVHDHSKWEKQKTNYVIREPVRSKMIEYEKMNLKPSAILEMLDKQKIECPSKKQLNNFLANYRQLFHIKEIAMNIPLERKGRPGRPKATTNALIQSDSGDPPVQEPISKKIRLEETLTVNQQPQVKKKRGRPVGSNKQKKNLLQMINKILIRLGSQKAIYIGSSLTLFGYISSKFIPKAKRENEPVAQPSSSNHFDPKDLINKSPDYIERPNVENLVSLPRFQNAMALLK